MLIKKTFSFLFKNFSLVAFFFLLSIGSEISAKPYSQIAKEASKYNVLIEGIQSGSGVIIRKEGSIYRVITAGHVVSDLKKGDELDLKTYDGKWHSVILQSIEKIGEVDLAIMDFYSKVDYPTAIIGKSNSIALESMIVVAIVTYTLPTNFIPILTKISEYIMGHYIIDKELHHTFTHALLKFVFALCIAIGFISLEAFILRQHIYTKHLEFSGKRLFKSNPIK